MTVISQICNDHKWQNKKISGLRLYLLIRFWLGWFSLRLQAILDVEKTFIIMLINFVI